MEELTQYIKTDFAVLVAVLYCIGRGMKALPKFPNHFIPLALTVCGIALACLSVVSRYASYGNWAGAGRAVRRDVGVPERGHCTLS